MNSLLNWNAIHELNLAGFPGRGLNKEESNAMWSKEAKIYDFMSGLEKEYTLNQVNSMILDKNDTVLDIGCGIGRLTVPVAERVGQVTALDIADKMMDRCKVNVKNAGLDNVTFKKIDWNEIEVEKDIEKHDIAFASRSVGLNDMIKLNSVAKKYAFLLSFSQYPGLKVVQMEMLTGIRGIENRKIDYKKNRMFGYNVTFNLLYDLGIDPMVRVLEDGFERVYHSKKEAYNDLRQVNIQFGEDCIFSDEEEKIFQSNVDKYITVIDGNYRFLRKTKTFVIGWKTIELY